MAATAQTKAKQITVAPAWGVLLRIVGIGKSALGGAGVGLALLGAANIIVIVAASNRYLPFTHSNQEALIQGLSLFGAVCGGIVGWITQRR